MTDAEQKVLDWLAGQRVVIIMLSYNLTFYFHCAVIKIIFIWDYNIVSHEYNTRIVY